MKVANETHQALPWVISEIAPDFELVDVWSPRIRGTLQEFDDFMAMMSSLDPTTSPSAASRMLFAVRLRLGSWLGWDDPEPRPIPGCRETTLRDRLPSEHDAKDAFTIASRMRQVAGGFTPLYRTDVEAAAEIANATVHGVLHVGWVEQTDGRYRPHLAVYVKPRGRLGIVYLSMIDPFRQFIVYPALMKHLADRWKQRDGSLSHPRPPVRRT